MKLWSNIRAWLHRIGRREVPVWFETSESITSEFQTIGKKLKIFRLIPNPFPFYDWIMGFYERVSNREALHGPSSSGHTKLWTLVLEQVTYSVAW